MLNKTLQKFLATNKAKYEIIEHKTVYTAFDKAATIAEAKEYVSKLKSVPEKYYGDGIINHLANYGQSPCFAPSLGCAVARIFSPILAKKANL